MRTRKPRRPRTPKKRFVSITYRLHGPTVRYIDVLSDQLENEVKRLTTVATTAWRHLSAPRFRVDHPIIKRVRFLLGQGPKPVLPGMPEANYVLEIGRLNHLIAEALRVLNTMKSEYVELQRVRFNLRFGQTSRKREMGWNSFNNRDRDTPVGHDPEPSYVEGDN